MGLTCEIGRLSFMECYLQLWILLHKCLKRSNMVSMAMRKQDQPQLARSQGLIKACQEYLSILLPRGAHIDEDIILIECQQEHVDIDLQRKTL